MTTLETLDLTSLPLELLGAISNFLTVSDYNNLSLANKDWNNFCCSNEDFWQGNFFKTGNYTKTLSQSWRQAYLHYYCYIKLLETLRSNLESELKEPCSISSYEPDWLETSLTSEIEPKISIDMSESLNQYKHAESLFQQENIDQTYFDKSLFRYEKFLDLKMKYPDVLLIPTLDIEMIWYSHLLRPAQYDKDCKKHFKKLIDHKLKLSDYEISVKSEAVIETKTLWEQEYNFPYYEKIQPQQHHELLRLSRYRTTIVDLRDSNSFEICLGVHDFELDPDFKPRFDFDFDAFKKDHRVDFSPLCFNACYYAFWDILMKHKDQVNQFAPIGNIDLYWHSHMLCPMEYQRDCINSFGFILDHVTDGSTKVSVERNLNHGVVVTVDKK